MNSSDPSKDDGQSAVVVLLPTDDDPVRGISSGDVPHTTLLYVDEVDDDSEIRHALDVVAQEGIDADPLDKVAGEGTLGDNGAYVYFLDAAFSLKVRDRLLEEGLTDGSGFPNWTPHMTIGDKDAPANHPQERPDGVVYDRLALFRDGEVIEYALFDTEEEAVTASADAPEKEELSEEDVAEALAQMEEDGEFQVPWHGVLAPEGVPSTDGRQFSKNALSHRNLPLPLMWTPESWGSHDGSVIVGRIDEVWREDGEFRASGVFDTSDNAFEAVRLMAEGMLRGVSVDVSNVTLAEAGEGVDEFAEAELAAATLVPIPAFREAYVALGPWDDNDEAPESQTASAAQFAVSEKEWDGDASRFTLEEYHKACIVHLHEGEPESKSDCKLPIREPNGDLSRAGVHAASARINQTDAPDEQISKAKASLRSAYEELDEDAPEVVQAAEGEDEEFVDKLLPKHKDAPGWITDPKPTKRITGYWVDGVGAAKIAWGTPGDFNRCRNNLRKYVKNPEWLAGLCANLHHRATGTWPGQHSAESGLVASSAPSVRIVKAAEDPLPAAWFSDPELEAPTPFTVTDEGRVLGHLASWDSCHIGIDEVCTTPPHSEANYSYFATGEVTTDEGPMPVGQIVMGGPHANPRERMKATWVHYASTSSALADVTVGEDAHGIWVAGAIRPGLTKNQLRDLKASALSGDWRKVRTMKGGGNLELVAALAVNNPGFPIPRAEMAEEAGEQLSLVAASIVAPEGEERSRRIAEAKAHVRAEKAARLKSEVASFAGGGD